jgi:hypothetical protein
LAVFFLLFSSLAAAATEYNKRNEQKNLDVMNGELSTTDTKIKTEIGNSELLSSEYNKDDIQKLLDGHIYVSKGLEFMKGEIIKDVYLQEADFVTNEAGDFTLSLKMNASNYSTAASQIVIFKDSYWAKDVNVDTLSSDKDGSASMQLLITLRKELFYFNQQYWDFGISVLTKDINRYIRIDNYSADLQSIKDDQTGEEKEYVVVKFDGVAYDKGELDAFEQKLNANTLNVDKLELNRADDSTNPGSIKFNGNMRLKY